MGPPDRRRQRRASLGNRLRPPDGELGLIEAGPFDKMRVEVMNPYEHMSQHAAAGDRVWVRRRAECPLTPEQSARLTAFACAQEGKPFALARWFGQLTPLRTRGPIKTWFVGEPRGDRPRWFCSELVMECCVAAGHHGPGDRQALGDLSQRPLLGPLLQPLPQLPPLSDLAAGWYPPARWLPALRSASHE